MGIFSKKSEAAVDLDDTQKLEPESKVKAAQRIPHHRRSDKSRADLRAELAAKQKAGRRGLVRPKASKGD